MKPEEEVLVRLAIDKQVEEKQIEKKDVEENEVETVKG
jgi:hypothetical protein